MTCGGLGPVVTDDGGTYTLLIELLEAATVEVGALGTYAFDPGWYAYTGSALGSGGFARVDRHRELAAGDRDTRHWHVDYLLGLDVADVDTVVTSAGVDIECAVTGELAAASIPDFGCSDCTCDSHLHYHPQRALLLDAVHDTHRSVAGDGRSDCGSVE
jgi:endonuclease-3